MTVLVAIAAGIYGALVLDGVRKPTQTTVITKISTPSAALRPSQIVPHSQETAGQSATNIPQQQTQQQNQPAQSSQTTIINNQSAPTQAPQPQPTQQSGINIPLPDLHLPLKLDIVKDVF